jgi:very-short-patch-repair endonuclease
VTTSGAAVRGRRRGPAWTKVDHGLYRPAGSFAGLHEELLAWTLVLPPSGAFTHLTAAAFRGWWLPPLPGDLPVFVSMSAKESRPQRARLRVSRHDPPAASTEHLGVPVVSAAEALLACARDLLLLDLVVLVDAALHSGDCDRTDIAAAARTGRKGSPLLRRALDLADRRSESAWETLLRVLHVVCDVPVEPQHVVRDEAGSFVARADLLVVGTRTIHEYDGGHHLQRDQQRRDLARLRRLSDEGWTRRGYTSHEVLRQANLVLRDADRALGRPHRPQRVDTWYALLSGSLFTPLGTDRLRRRLGLPAGALP